MITRTKIMVLGLFFVSKIYSQNSIQTPIEAYFPVYKNGKMGYIDVTGKIKFNIDIDQPGNYNTPEIWDGEITKVKLKDKYYAFNRSGGLVMQEGFDNIYIDNENKLIKVGISKDKYGFSYTYGFYNFKGENIIPVKYETAFFTSGFGFYDGLWAFKENGKFGFMNMKGEVVIKPAFNDVTDFSNGFSIVKLEEKGLYGVINLKGEIVIKPQFKSISSFNKNGFSLAKVNSLTPEFIIINNKGVKISSLKTLRPYSFFSSGGFDEKGMCKVIDSTSKLEGYIDQTGKTVIPVKYTYIGSFGKDEVVIANTNGVDNDAKYFKDKEGGEWTLLDRQGKEQFKPLENLRRMQSVSEGMILYLSTNGKWGFMDLKGNVVIKPQYTKMPSYFDKGLCKIYGEDIKDGEYSTKTPFGYINKLGQIVWEINI